MSKFFTVLLIFLTVMACGSDKENNSQKISDRAMLGYTNSGAFLYVQDDWSKTIIPIEMNNSNLNSLTQSVDELNRAQRIIYKGSTQEGFIINYVDAHGNMQSIQLSSNQYSGYGHTNYDNSYDSSHLNNTSEMRSQIAQRYGDLIDINQASITDMMNTISIGSYNHI